MSRGRDYEKENRELRAELRKQWESNHAEHCQWEWPHEGMCLYPPPVVLGLVAQPRVEDGE